MASKEEMPPVMILCGGKGTRLREVTELLPKPMVPVGGQPILWHIMKSYAAFGVRRFILCLGYKKEDIIDYFVHFRLRTEDATIRLGERDRITFHGEMDEADWEVTLANTGLDTLTGGRVLRAAKYLRPDDREFFLTYGDGVADIDIASELAFHRAGGKLLTVAAAHPAGRFGAMDIDAGQVRGFEEKPAKSEEYVNGGFMVVDREVVPRYLTGIPDCFFEAAPMNAILRDGEMRAFCHEGFWQCMDTPREHRMLNELWNVGKAPWTKYWKEAHAHV